MRRFAWLTLLLLPPSLPSQTRDVVYYFDRASKSEKLAAFEGSVVEETVNGVKVKPSVGPERFFSVLELVDVSYALPRTSELKFQTITLAEAAVRAGTADRPRLEQLLRDYLALIDHLRDAKTASLRRHVAFRIACLKAQLAESVEQLQDAVNTLAKLRTDLLESWQLIPAARLHAQLLLDLARTADALEVMDAASRTPRLSRDVKRELGLDVIDLMLRCQQHRDAEARIADELSDLPNDHDLHPVLNLYQVAARNWTSPLEDLIGKVNQTMAQSQSTAIKAVGYNLLGHIYSSRNRLEDALWSYLWVDVVYYQDRRERIKALERLVSVFTELKDEARAERYRDKLRSLRQ